MVVGPGAGLAVLTLAALQLNQELCHARGVAHQPAAERQQREVRRHRRAGATQPKEAPAQLAARLHQPAGARPLTEATARSAALSTLKAAHPAALAGQHSAEEAVASPAARAAPRAGRLEALQLGAMRI